jgi:hypothetical protein
MFGSVKTVDFTCLALLNPWQRIASSNKLAKDLEVFGFLARPGNECRQIGHPKLCVHRVQLSVLFGDYDNAQHRTRL